MRFSIRHSLRLTVALAASLGVVLLLLECFLISIPERFKEPFGIGAWLLDIAVIHYGIPATAVSTIAALAAAAIMASRN